MKKLNENQMKLVMTVLMTLYTVNCFFPVQNAVLYFYLSKPAVAWAGFAAAEGFRHTSDVRKYLMRLYVFAAIMFLGNIVLNTGFGTEKTFLGDNTFLTLALGVSSLCFFKKASHAEDRMQKTASFFAGAVSAAAGFAMQYGYLMIPVMVISAWCGNKFRKRDSMMILFSLLLFVLELQQGDSLLIEKLSYRFHDPERFDVVVFDYLYHEAKLDGLTGLLGRQQFFHIGEELLRRNGEKPPVPGKSGCFIILDVDRFKQINDTYGHPAGDQILKEVAKKFQEAFGNGNIFGRLGGDEFVALILEPLSKEEIGRALTKMKEELKNLEIQNTAVTCSIGVIPIEKNYPLERMYKDADRLLYEAKKNGKDQFVFGYRYQDSETDQEGMIGVD